MKGRIKMKKIAALLLVLVMTLAAFAGCSSNKETSEVEVSKTESIASEIEKIESEVESEDKGVEPTKIRLGGLKGATTMGMVKLLDDAENGKSFNDYDFTLAVSADELTPKLASGDLDIVAVPSNLGSVLANNTEGKIQMLAINTLGVLYIVENGDSVNSIEDLRGKEIYATGKGAMPEYTLHYLLKENGLDPETDVTIEWKSEPSEVVATLGQKEGAIGMLPQPFVAVAQTNLEGLRVSLDLTEEWGKINDESMLISGILVVRKDFADEYPEQLDMFLEEYKASTEYVNTDIEDAAKLIEKYDIVKAPIAEKAIPFCNIVYIAGEEMIAPLNGYLEVLFEQNPKSVGGELPKEEYYYVSK